MKKIVELIGELGLSAENFDYVLLGDGSGTVVGAPCAWHVFVIELKDGVERETKVYGGGLTSGTNNVAELMPYIMALWQINPAGLQRQVRVLIVSDSEVTVRCGGGQYERRANAGLWASISWFESNGCHLTWKHVPRNSNPYNKSCDKRAGVVRSAMKDFAWEWQDEELTAVVYSPLETPISSEVSNASKLFNEQNSRNEVIAK